MELDGDVELVGPGVSDVACTLGLPCRFALDGYGLTEENKIVPISSGRCGEEGAVVANAAWRSKCNYTEPNQTGVDGAHATYIFGTPSAGSAGSFYKLCWGHAPQSFAEFDVEVDVHAGSCCAASGKPEAC